MNAFPPCGERWQAKPDGWGVKHRPFPLANAKPYSLMKQPPHPSRSAAHLPPQWGKEIEL
jgi:hypothetical protein